MNSLKKLWLNSVTRQVTFNRTKLVEIAKIEKFKRDIFGNFQTLWAYLTR